MGRSVDYPVELALLMTGARWPQVTGQHANWCKLPQNPANFTPRPVLMQHMNEVATSTPVVAATNPALLFSRAMAK